MLPRLRPAAQAALAAALAVALLGCPEAGRPERPSAPRDASSPAGPPPPREDPPPAPAPPVPPPHPGALAIQGTYRAERLALVVTAEGGEALAGTLQLRGVAYPWSGTFVGPGLSGTVGAEGKALPFQALPTPEGGLELHADGERYRLERTAAGAPPLPRPPAAQRYRGRAREVAVELEVLRSGADARGRLRVGQHRYALWATEIAGALRGRLRDTQTGDEASLRLELTPQQATLVVDLPRPEEAEGGAWETLVLERDTD